MGKPRTRNIEKTIAFPRDRLWPQMAKQKGDKVSKKQLSARKKRDGRANVGDVSMRIRNGAPPRKEYVVNGQMTETSKK